MALAAGRRGGSSPDYECPTEAVFAPQPEIQ